MDLNKVQLNLTTPGEVIIREGKAIPYYDPLQVEVRGTIESPLNYMQVITPDPQTDMVMFSRSDLEISYHKRIQDKFGPMIIGRLLENQDLALFGINKGKIYGPKSLAQFLKMNRFFFDDKNQCMEIIGKLNSYVSTVTIQKEQIQDSRGTNRAVRDKSVTSNVPTTFKLTTPVFAGCDSSTFNVEICFDDTDAGTTCWLESVELREIMISMRDALMNSVLDRIKTFGLVIIERQ